MPADHEPPALADPAIDVPVDREVKIDDGITVLAKEVIVRLHVGVQPIEGAAESDPVEATLLDEDADVPVHRSHAEFGELIAQLAVKPVCGRVAIHRLQKLKDSFSLFASPIGSLLPGSFAELSHTSYLDSSIAAGRRLAQQLFSEDRSESLLQHLNST